MLLEIYSPVSDIMEPTRSSARTLRETLHMRARALIHTYSMRTLQCTRRCFRDTASHQR